MTLHAARILSSETDNTIKQEQNTNVNIKIAKPNPVYYPEVNPNVNFTQDGELPQTKSTFQFQPPINSQFQGRGIAEIGSEITELEKRNKFLEMVIEMYENNPMKVNSYVVCESKLLMDMIKLLTECDKVELVLNNDIGCSGCSGKDKFIYVAKILITKDGKTEDFKYGYNEMYTQFVKFGISLKIVV